MFDSYISDLYDKSMMCILVTENALNKVLCCNGYVQC